MDVKTQQPKNSSRDGTPIETTSVRKGTTATARLQRTYTDKKKIVLEAYSQPTNVTETAKKYRTSKRQILRWKSQLTKHGMLDDDFSRGRTQVARKQRTMLTKKKIGTGRKPISSEEDLESLHEYYTNQREAGLQVTVRMLSTHLLQLTYGKNPSEAEAVPTLSQMDKRIRRWAKVKGIVLQNPSSKERTLETTR